MKRIGEISPIKELKDSDKIFKIAENSLPENCFWREEKKIHLEILCFLAEQLQKEKEISTETICFYCSIQNTSYYQDCAGKPTFLLNSH